MSISILVVLYNCEILESATIWSLLNSKLMFGNVNLIIWNNGPKKIACDENIINKFKEKGLLVTLIQTIQNLPLSYVYNSFIEKYSSDYYVFLDNDSSLNDTYLNHILKLKKLDVFFVGVPIINVRGISYSPSVRNEFSSGPFKKDDKVIAVGSGIVLNNKAIQTIQKSYNTVFDVNFALYGVDTTFFLRVHSLGFSDRISIMPSFDHSLSRLEVESETMTNFRLEERSYDIGLTLRHYPSFEFILTFFRMIAGRVIGRNRFMISKVLKAFVEGKHNRCVR